MDILQLYYWNRSSNFGDELNVYLCKQLFGLDVTFSPPEKCEASFIGSLLDDFLWRWFFTDKNYLWRRRWQNAPVNIWGSGFINDKNEFVVRPFSKEETYFRRVNLYAVRGEYSLRRLQRIFDCNFHNCVIGDPGLLVSELINVSLIEKKYKYGIIPHHIERNDSVYQNISLSSSTIIDVCDPVDKVIHDIAQCDIILSASLHGLIAADSLGIPSARIIASDKIIGGDYKFNDYYSAYGDYKKNAIDIRNMTIDDINKDKIIQESTPDSTIIQNKKEMLFNSFPYAK